jgi:hypothetical protein
MWVETPAADNYNLLIENHCSASDCDAKITENHLNF